MSIATELQNYADGLDDAYDAVNDMSGIIPQHKNMNNLDQAIRTIPQNTGTTYTAGTGIDITSDVISVDNTTVPFFTDLATVATTGDYGDLLNTPTIPAAQVNSDWNANSGVAQILNKPSLATVATSGLYSDLTGTPSLATVATSGDYDDLLNKPTIPTATSDLANDGSDGTSTYVEASDLATVATSGLYSDLSGTPTIPTKTSDLTNNGSDNTSTYVEADELAAVATSGSYTDLSDKPTIPAAQVQSNWTQTTTTAVDYIKNKPTIPTVNNATLTIQKNGSNVATFTANASSNVTANISVPSVTSTSSQLDVGTWHFFIKQFTNSTAGWVSVTLTGIPSAFKNKIISVICTATYGNSANNYAGTWWGQDTAGQVKVRLYQTTAGSNGWYALIIAVY